MTKRAEELITRYRKAKETRDLWAQHWEDLARVQLPRRMGFITQVVQGERRTEDLYDGTSIQAARDLAQDMGGMLRPEGERWFFLKTAEKRDMMSDAARFWLNDTGERMRDAFDDARARFRQATGEADIDMVVFGTAIMGVFEKVGKRHLIFQTSHLKDGVPIFDEDGNLMGMFRERMMTLEQARRRWGAEKLSEQTRQKLQTEQKTQLDEKISFLFSVMPRENGDPDAKFANRLPFEDMVIEIEAKHEVLVGGFHEMPYIAPRWDTTSGEDYGRSPGMIALPDSNTSQAIGETMLVAGQRAADPPLLTPSDAFIDAPNTFPGGLGHYEADAVKDLGFDPFKILETGRNFPISRDIQQDVRESIRAAFMRNMFNLPAPGEANMTATEVIARQREFVRAMGPVFGRVEADYTAPMVERAFQVMLRAGAFLPLPEEWLDRRVAVRFEYESPVKRLREQAAAVAAEQWVNQNIAFATSAQKPEILDNVNFDEWSQFSARALGVPMALVSTDEQKQEKRAGRQQAMEAAQAEAEVQSGAETLDTLAGAADKAGLTQEQPAPTPAPPAGG